MSTNVNKNVYTENKKVANYYCADCDYFTVRRSNFEKHILTKKHIKKVSTNVNKCQQNVNKIPKNGSKKVPKSAVFF